MGAILIQQTQGAFIILSKALYAEHLKVCFTHGNTHQVGATKFTVWVLLIELLDAFKGNKKLMPERL